MPDRLIPALSVTCGALSVLYVTLVITTIFFASWQTEAMSSVRNAESQIGNLEANYYTAMNQASTLTPAALGFVTPTQVEYIPEVTNTSANLTFAGN